MSIKDVTSIKLLSESDKKSNIKYNECYQKDYSKSNEMFKTNIKLEKTNVIFRIKHFIIRKLTTKVNLNVLTVHLVF